LETGLGGWGARIRTWEWRNQNPQKPLTHIEFLFSYCICVAPSVESAFSSERDRAEHLTGRDASIVARAVHDPMYGPAVRRKRFSSICRLCGLADGKDERRQFVGVRVCPETLGWIAEFSEHEAD
jgi:hypothetical protein